MVPPVGSPKHMDSSQANYGDSKRKRRLSSQDHERPPYLQSEQHSSRTSRIGPDYVSMYPSPTPPISTFVPSRTHNHVQINYFAQQYSGDLPLISSEDTIPSILNILNNYSAVIERHESLAGNMGARPLGPILLKRFERIFDGPPTVLSSPEIREPISWLDVLDFARNQPDQFVLTQLADGSKVCQFTTKQCRIQISEEDYFLVSSGMPQKLIPPQPIAEDEEKELGTLEIVERNISQITHLADQVAVRARQLNHRLRGRKHAILERRAIETVVSGAGSLRAPSPSSASLGNGMSIPESSQGVHTTSTRQDGDIASGDTLGVSQSTYNDLRKSLLTVSQKRAGFEPDVSETITQNAPVHKRINQSTDIGVELYHTSMLPRSGSKPHSPTDKSYGSHSLDEGGPFKAEMVARLESLVKGGRIVPPCDRCRRLNMDCFKNLTACMGCTKKHAKCSWKEVKDYELRDHHRNLSSERGRPYDHASHQHDKEIWQ